MSDRKPPSEHRLDYQRKWHRERYRREVQSRRKPCIEGRIYHRYDPDGVCIHCGAERLG